MRDDFTVFILSHGRADNVITLRTLADGGYTGNWYIVIDNEDEQESEYRKRYGDKVIQFDKLAISKTFDTGDRSDNRKTVVYARNACFDIAKRLGYKYFLELDDDYTGFQARRRTGMQLLGRQIKNLNKVFGAMVEFLETSGAITVALAQGGDLIGGKDSKRYKAGLIRKAMNTFFCTTERPFQFVGRINEDVNTYTLLGQQGKLMLTYTRANIVQCETQQNKGGMTDVYVDNGTYLKSFFTVMYCPSCVTISAMGRINMRIHHRIDWEHCTPKIINERYRKRR